MTSQSTSLPQGQGSPFSLDCRRAGVLLHITSLPGRWCSGDMGAEAYRFVEFLAGAGQTVWQVLPLGPTHSDGSPYNCFSSQAGNVMLISPELMVEAGWLSEADLDAAAQSGGDDPRYVRSTLISKAFREFSSERHESEHAAFAAFIETQQQWLEDYALFWVLKQEHRGGSWQSWPEPLRERCPDALAEIKEQLADELEQVRFEQYVFFRQWHALKQFANERGVSLFGDMPIFVAYDSADVWTHRNCFELDEEGRPRVVAGVPPDYFSATGQRWGNPLYNWPHMVADGFRWWIARMETQLQLYDLIRIDHFRGFEAYWEIPASEETAINGQWIKAPGDELFAALRDRFGALPLVAEDLGQISHEVHELRLKYALPGMKILQFAFDGGADNPYLPHNHECSSVVYTGTHDNDTTLGWYNALSEAQHHHIGDYLGCAPDSMPWSLIRSAYVSVANLCVIPMQDILMLDGAHRMNVPGSCSGNWQWRFQWTQVNDGVAGRLRRMVDLYGRAGS
ncbi:MAG: 4-alpha-glucanotransferase [Gammaproteobacteria bacterium]|nr:4-alpha-glucanotransferase [Gammaproteobacteria bacterium]